MLRITSIAMNWMVPVICRAPLGLLFRALAMSRSVNILLKPSAVSGSVMIMLFEEMSRWRILPVTRRDWCALIASRIDSSNCFLVEILLITRPAGEMTRQEKILSSHRSSPGAGRVGLVLLVDDGGLMLGFMKLLE